MRFWAIPRKLATICLLAGPALLLAQGNFLMVDPPRKIAAKRGETVEARLAVRVRDGFHVNSDQPAEDYLIPLRLKWEAGPLAPEAIVFPKPEMRKYEFSQKPLSVFTGNFEITARFKVDPKAAPGPGVLVGKLHYQACSHNTCYRPATVEVRLPYEIQ